ncbi:hypothetical protein LDL08_22305 [Nonomuraea glycinis]|uniref:hypothetical protein n=1 Tax=Nonomuraea glycinis TaxID=2047744 RepID=UPI00166B9E4E|nr:hypothetical protein [Nonomuraea glycinis]MCA2178926.1 hypothetical protein [Nonomuraea glycinis]
MPTRKTLGTEQPKTITVGNWAAKSTPLTELKSGDQDVNRTRFSKIEMFMDVGTSQEMSWLIPANNDRHKVYINYCK